MEASDLYGGNVLKTFVNCTPTAGWSWRHGSGSGMHNLQPQHLGFGKPGKSWMLTNQTNVAKMKSSRFSVRHLKTGKVGSDRGRQSILTSALYICMYGGTYLHMHS